MADDEGRCQGHATTSTAMSAQPPRSFFEFLFSRRGAASLTALGLAVACACRIWWNERAAALGLGDGSAERSRRRRPIDHGALTRVLGGRPKYLHKSVSIEGFRMAAAFKPKPSDVYILTPPKTGTTWATMICHALRSSDYNEAVQFQDIYQVAPWDILAWDLNQDLDADQGWHPRLFKTHERLSAINRGARYLCMVRSVEAVALSWWNFLKDKEVPAVQPLSLSEFVHNKDFFDEGMRFGATIWEYYSEFYRARRLPQVLVLCYEDLEDDLRGHLGIIAEFMGLDPEKAEGAAAERVVRLCSRDSMRTMGSKFDESWAYRELQRVGRINNAETFAPSARVRPRRMPGGPRGPEEVLDSVAQRHLKERWRQGVYLRVGVSNYEEMRAELRAEVQRRRLGIFADPPPATLQFQ